MQMINCITCNLIPRPFSALINSKWRVGWRRPWTKLPKYSKNRGVFCHVAFCHILRDGIRQDIWSTCILASMIASTIIDKALADMDILDESHADSEFEFDMADDD